MNVVSIQLLIAATATTPFKVRHCFIAMVVGPPKHSLRVLPYYVLWWWQLQRELLQQTIIITKLKQHDGHLYDDHQKV